MTDPLGAAVRAAARHLDAGPAEDLRKAVREVADALAPDGNPDRLVERVRLLAVNARLGSDPYKPENALRVLCEEAGRRPAGRFVDPNRSADPGLALELFALVYSSLAFRVQEEANASVKELLRVAGVSPRGLRPAAVVVRADKLPVGATLHPDTTAFVPTVVRRLGGDPEPVAATPQNEFRPAWSVVGWVCEKVSKSELLWRVTVPPAALLADDKAGFQAYIAAGHDRVFDLAWSLRVGPNETWPLTLRPWAPTPADAPQDYRARLDWFAFAAQGDKAGARLADRWVTFRPARPIPPQAGEVTGELIALPVAKDVELVANCAAWLNVGPQPSGETTAFDRLGMWEWAVRLTAGDWFNGARVVGAEEGKPQEWTAVAQPEGLAVALHALGAVSGGRPAESDDEFLRRAPAVLRHRGSPASAADWEHFVREADPAERIAGVAAHGTLLPRGSMVAVGVRVLFHAVGPVGPAARLAAWLRDAWVNHLAVAVRPLGTEVELYVPQPVVVACTPAAGLGRPDAIKDLKRVLDPTVSSAGDPNPLWRFLLDRFRHRGPARPAEVADLLAEFAADHLKRLALAPTAVTFRAADWVAGGRDTSAVPVPQWKEPTT